MKKCIRVLVLCFAIIYCVSRIWALRDPFYPASGCHSYVCAAIGTIHGGSRFALLAIDAVSYRVKEGECVVGHTVVKIRDEMIMLKDEQGREQYIPLKKRPFNLDKLKG